MISIHNLSGGYTSSPIINGLDLDILKGEFFALLGKNGSGKTTLFKLVTGQLPIKSGNVLVSGKDIQSLSKLEKAKKMAVLTQEVHVSFDYTVEEIISLGRYPYQRGFFKHMSKKDWKVIEEVMELTNVTDLRKAPFRMISGGEKQRVLLAKALAQEPEILLLDEPTNHLDIKHTFHLLDLLKDRQQMMGLTIFAILHDLNVASLYADRIALLHDGSFLEVGDVDRLRKVDQLKKVYEVKVNSQSHPIVPKPQFLMTPNYAASREFYRFEDSYQLKRSDEYLHVQFDQPLRTISNGVMGAGLQWLKHFCAFHVEKDYDNPSPERDLQNWMEKYSIPYEQAVGMITTAKPVDTVVITETIENIEMMIILTLETGNAVDITKRSGSEADQVISCMNMMLFIDADFTDGALVSGYMSAVEAKTKALQNQPLSDPHSHTVAADTPPDVMVLALTQQGMKISNAGNRTMIGKGMAQLVNRAFKEVLNKHLLKVPQ
ncbi:adenosylcobinamide amidohydrolase [Niallia oryzisoli]|uniref:Adenosylcobinamide amidohydrolase n=1 Tax=Niallia oryzisoli TaxID=1737571 RepID=A0ABZ2CNT8_9BACI